MRQKAITLLSGGLDSTVATVLAGEEFDIHLALTFDYGQRAAKREIEAARSLCRNLNIEHRAIELGWLEEITQTALVNRSKPIPETTPKTLEQNQTQRAKAVWVPNRNALFVAIGGAFAESAGSQAIIAGFNAEEAISFPDNSQSFVDAANTLFEFSTRGGIKIISPTLKMKKTEIASRLMQLKVNPDSFWCCYEGGEKLCGRCESCARTIRAFKQAGLWNHLSERFE